LSNVKRLGVYVKRPGVYVKRPGVYDTGLGVFRAHTTHNKVRALVQALLQTPSRVFVRGIGAFS